MDPLIVFALLVFGIIALPGMDMAFVLGSSLAGGREAGFAAVAGIVAGGVLHVAMGAFGVGLLLQLFPAAFNALLVVGAAYVAWIAWNLWMNPTSLVTTSELAPRLLRRTFGQAVTTCMLNPKAYLFMVAVFPQFLHPDRGSIPQQAFLLGLIISGTQTLVYGFVAVSAASFRNVLARSSAEQAWIARAVAILLAATAAWTLLRAWHSLSN